MIYVISDFLVLILYFRSDFDSLMTKTFRCLYDFMVLMNPSFPIYFVEKEHRGSKMDLVFDHNCGDAIEN